MCCESVGQANCYTLNDIGYGPTLLAWRSRRRERRILRILPLTKFHAGFHECATKRVVQDHRVIVPDQLLGNMLVNKPLPSGIPDAP